jgi:hypothetical protein
MQIWTRFAWEKLKAIDEDYWDKSAMASYTIHVVWREPDDHLNWKQFDARGPLNHQFEAWAKRHVEFWQPKALCPLLVTKIEYEPQGCPDRTW